MSGTDIGCAATRPSRAQWPRDLPYAICLRACYALLGTDVACAHGAARLRACGTDVAFGATRLFALGESTEAELAACRTNRAATAQGELPTRLLRAIRY
eukprot:2528420-Rhodomonas_salina.2